MTKAELKEFLEHKVAQYNQPEFIETDPIQIPHRYSRKEDREIAGFLTATIAWGNRKSILKNASTMMQLLDDAPYEFVKQHQENDLAALKPFVHRTFNGLDFQYFVQALQYLYQEYEGLEGVFTTYSSPTSTQQAIHQFKRCFFELPHLTRTQKHVSDPQKKSAAKRINMFLRWMVRQDHHGVDFGIWKNISPAALSCPLDVHSGNIARKIGLLQRKQNDAKAVAELDKNLRKLDPLDPVKYDFALFGLGVFEKF